MDAADELAAIVFARLQVLEEINQNTFHAAHPTNCGPVQRGIEDMRSRVTRFNLKTILLTPNPLFDGDH